MAYPNRIQQTLLNAVTPVAITSSTDATPIVITATAHGFNTGDRVGIYGHTTNIAANGIFTVTKLSANTFSLQDEFSGANIAGSGAGAGSSGICFKAPPVMLVQDFKTLELQVGTSGTATVTLHVIGSLGIPGNPGSPRMDLPNMGATITPSNPWQELQIVDLGSGSALNAGTGIAVTGTDIEKQYEVNINNTKWLTVIPISWSAGAVSVVASGMTPA